MNHKYNIAILVSCFNRKEKTLSCLKSVFLQNEDTVDFTVYLIDNGSDGTSKQVNVDFPKVKTYVGSKNLFWAQSMRVIWQTVIDTGIDYDYCILLNDDTILVDSAFHDLMADLKRLDKKEVVLVGSTMDPVTRNRSYGGSLLLNEYGLAKRKLTPNNTFPQLCHLGNANVMLVPKETVKKIGILSNLYSHGIADYDYTLRARKAGIPSFIASGYTGYCENDHGNNWWPSKKFTLKQRIKNLYDVKGLAYKEYLLYLRLHFPYYVPHAWFMMWIKILFPFLWERFKKPEGEET